MVAVVWFRQDLRIADNPALCAAADSGRPVLPVHGFDPDADNPFPDGEAGRWWRSVSLDSLERDLAAKGSRLVLKRGAPDRILAELRPTHVFWNESVEPWTRRQDERLRESLRRRGVVAESFPAATLFEPGAIRTRSGRPFQVFSAFERACGEPALPLPEPAALPAPDAWPESDPLPPVRKATADRLRARWRPGSASAARRIAEFAVDDYDRYRDLPAVDGTSRLSAHLHFGEIGAREVWHELEDRSGPGARKFRSELVWREFAAHLLYWFPQLPDRPLNRRFERFPWRRDTASLERWQAGRTGYPIVDAGMRELRETGWMHNRVRMIVGSFLTKHLLIDWREGAKWFWESLVDADLANNTTGWQWIAGCGPDAVPYFRIFNPVLQGKRFDADGAYVRRWVPELADLDARSVHTPWTLPVPPEDYPAPIVDHRLARERALAAFRETAAGGDA